METTQPQVGEVNEVLVDAQPQAEEVKETAQPTATETEQQPTATAETTFELEVKYNKESKKLTREEAVEFAQKGMNYDKLQARLKEIDTELESLKKPLEPLTQKLGKKPNEVAEYFARQYKIAEDAKLARAQGKSTEDVTAFREEREARQAAEAKANALETAEQTRQRHLQEASDFQTEFPNVDIQNLPEEVKENWLNSGKPLNEAYRIFSYAAKEAELTALQERIRTMESQQKAAEINAENAATAPGKLGEGATAEQPLTEKAISEMTPAELEKNHSKIWAYLTGAKK